MSKNSWGKRSRAVKKYKKDMLDEHGYISCESANCDDANRAFPPHSVHHIMSAGRYPNRKYLHDPINLIMLCDKCHKEFHAGKREEEHNILVTERGLDKLIKRR